MTATNPGSSFAAKAQSLVPALLVAAAIGMVWQMFNMHHALGALEANTATLVEQGRDHGNQLRDLDHRMAAVEAQITALIEAVNRIAPK
jgi:hypothetical protein